MNEGSEVGREDARAGKGPVCSMVTCGSGAGRAEKCTRQLGMEAKER